MCCQESLFHALLAGKRIRPNSCACTKSDRVLRNQLYKIVAPSAMYKTTEDARTKNEPNRARMIWVSLLRACLISAIVAYFSSRKANSYRED
jgi:hypothetical protein